jgi:2,3-bisphosphoglycerate-dependent phosphoglycerate mutase
VRHGEPQSAVDRVLSDTGLSSVGREQARARAVELAGVPFRGVLSSPMDRARETALLLADELGLAVEFEPLLVEGALGALAGLSLAAARARFPQHFRLGSSVMARLRASGETAPGGESRCDFRARARAAAERLRAELERDEGPLLVVAHGGLFNVALQFLLGVPPTDRVPFGFDHCGVLRVLRYAEEPDFGPFPMLRF